MNFGMKPDENIYGEIEWWADPPMFDGELLPMTYFTIYRNELITSN